MTTKMRRTKITIERHEITIIRQRGKQISFFCNRCQSVVAAFTPDEIAARFQIPIGELGKSGEIHFIETSEGNLPLICSSLPIQ